ncbi:MAG: transcriptional repressor [Candidatus Omnitrophica bacterium]|nr:transcriptional repressor [Candidatus Omnitrophota bacterium]MBI3009912.1 transcriptional repressor [Candidatus Omnitrophota bacterium]
MKRFVEVEQFLKARGVRLTGERQLIVRRAVSYLHFTAEELVKDVRTIDPTVARGTVYRTLGLLHRTGVVEKHDFRYGPPNYEVTFAKAHHDHLMCIQCGEIIEFQEPRVEHIQEQVVKRYGYQLLSHTHKLYGLCQKCRHVNPKRASKAPMLHVEEIVA